MNAYNISVPPNEEPTIPPGAAAASARWELYRLLADPVRPRLLALVSVEELGVGELADLLREGQPKISRHASALREAGIVVGRKQGTWTLLRLAPGAAIPDLNPLNPKFRLFIAAWKRLPLPVANLIGPHIVRGLG